MINTGIPANADNKVVAGENAKEMTVEILEGFVADATKCDIDTLVDATWDWLSDGLSDIVEDCDGDLWLVFSQSGVSTDAIWEDVEEMCKDEGYDIDLYDWCEENDINLDDMITDAADEIVENDDNLVWVSKGWDRYLGVFYKNECDMVDEIREYVEKAAEEVFFTHMKTQFEWFFDEETMLEEDGDGSLIAVVGAFEGEEYDNVYNAVRDQWENDTDTDLDKCCSIARVDIEDMIYDVVDTIVEDSRNMKWKDNSDRILGFIYNENNELAA